MSELQVNNIQPISGQALTIKDEGGTASITVATNGEATFAEDVVITAGKGITFSSTNTPAQSYGTGAHNTLDDYEEGSFSVFLNDSSSHGGNSLSASGTQAGSYTKIGNFVYFSIAVTLDKTSLTGTNSMYIHGLPFTASSEQNFYECSPPRAASGYITATDTLHSTVVHNTTHIIFYKNSHTQSPTQAQIQDIGTTDTTKLRLAGCYRTT